MILILLVITLTDPTLLTLVIRNLNENQAKRDFSRKWSALEMQKDKYFRYKSIEKGIFEKNTSRVPPVHFEKSYYIEGS